MKSEPTTTHPAIIGITTYGRNASGDFHLPGQYVDAVRNAGGVPILLPPGEPQISHVLSLIDGLIFAGGGDIDPGLYGGQNHPSVARVDPERDQFELSLAKAVLTDTRPILGICRGSQILNIAAGGGLIEHIPDQYGQELLHRTGAGGITQHNVVIETKSHLGKIIGRTDLQVVSKHHQAVRGVSPDWQIVARAPDGVIEAIEHKTHPWMIGVLWHPELSLQDTDHQKLFRAFVQAAQKRKASG